MLKISIQRLPYIVGNNQKLNIVWRWLDLRREEGERQKREMGLQDEDGLN